MKYVSSLEFIGWLDEYIFTQGVFYMEIWVSENHVRNGLMRTQQGVQRRNQVYNTSV